MTWNTQAAINFIASGKRTGIYLVRTDFWYVERTVWLIAGLDVLAGTALAWMVHPLWACLITSAGICSAIVGLGGPCIAGTILMKLGARPLLSQKPGGWYFIQNDSWFLERRIYLIVGINLTMGSLLLLLHSRWWVLYTGFVGAASVLFALSGFCIMAHILWKRGAAPRLGKP